MDKYNKVEKLLSNYKMLKVNIENMQEEINYLKDNNGIKGLSYDGIPTSPTNVTSNTTEVIALSNIELTEYLECQILRAEVTIEKIERTLAELEEVERTVLTERYMNNKQWWKVASIVCYSERHCKRIRSDGINKMVVGLYGKSGYYKG